MVATKPVDFRKGAEGLAALVRETMGADPFSGAVYPTVEGAEFGV
jgi:transposase